MTIAHKAIRPKTPRDHWLDPAASIICRLGGAAHVAEVLGVSPQSGFRWMLPREEGGSGGLIPQWHHRRLLDYARWHRVKLTAEDFLPPSPARPRRRAQNVPGGDP
jgi:hypothetical protein